MKETFVCCVTVNKSPKKECLLVNENIDFKQIRDRVKK